jgi:uncharacterized OsmC-like protein
MTIIKKNDGNFGIYNEAGIQAEGSFTPNTKGLNPRELLEASIGMCMTVGIQRMLERDGIIVQDDEYSVEVTCVKAPDSPSRFEKIQVNIALPDSLPANYKNKLIVSAERACTIGNTVRKSAIIETNQY